jgi:hypothetical protein
MITTCSENPLLNVSDPPFFDYHASIEHKTTGIVNFSEDSKCFEARYDPLVTTQLETMAMAFVY